MSARLAQVLAEEEQVALVVATPSAVDFSQYAQAKSVREIPGFEEFDSSDIVIPRRKIVQGTTRDVDPKLMGQIIDSLTGGAKPEVNMVLLRYSHTRAYFEPGNFTPDGLICASSNGRVPRQGVKESQCATCDVCPLSQWSGEEKPACAGGYTFLAIDVDDDDAPFMITFAGTAIKATKKMISAVALKKRPFFAFEVTLATTLNQDERGKWYAPLFTARPITDAARITRYAELFQGYAAVQLETDASTVAEESEGEAPAEGQAF